MSNKKSILKPAARAGASVSFRVPGDLSARLFAVRAASQQRGLVFDIDPILAKALARHVRQAEIELAESICQSSPLPVTSEVAGPLPNASQEFGHEQ